MKKDEKKLSHYQKLEPSAGLFERIILAIKKEQERQQMKKLLFSFFFFLIVSIVAAPLSWTIFINQLKSSGLGYFISAALSNLDAFFAFWQDFILAIAESLPIMGIAVFTINIILVLFTLRLFLSRKGLLPRLILLLRQN